MNCAFPALFSNPDAAKEDEWNGIYDTPFPLKVDFNAKRLAVTAINQAAWSGMMMSAQDNPFADYVHWQLSGYHAIYDICDTYAEHDEGLGLGNFSLDNVPLPHPFCQCLWYVDTDKSLDDIARELYRWEQGESNPKLDKAFGNAQIEAGVASHNYAIDTTSLPGAAKPEPEVLRALENAYAKMLKDFPVLENTLQTVFFGYEPGIASANVDGNFVTMDSTHFKTLSAAKKILLATVRSGHTGYAQNPMLIFAHEVGHTLFSKLALFRMGNIPQSRRTYSAKLANEQEAILSELNQYVFGRSDLQKKDYEAIEREMGSRALDNTKELVAQAFGMKYYGMGKHPIANAITDYIMNDFKRRRINELYF